VIEGSDNFATKFLAADAAKLAGVSIAQAGAVRFSGWALCSTAALRGACVRCLFEDIPRGMPETCAAAGVLGPVVGVLGALQASLALSLLWEHDVTGTLFRYDALSCSLRRHRLARRGSCPLCAGDIQNLDPERYVGACAA
ncbi:MAG TPA: ThiF family adenylyltransferase, partial [Polyangiales bacterium]